MVKKVWGEEVRGIVDGMEKGGGLGGMDGMLCG